MTTPINDTMRLKFEPNPKDGIAFAFEGGGVYHHKDLEVMS